MIPDPVGLLTCHSLCALMSAKWALELHRSLWQQILWGLGGLLLGPVIPGALYILLVKKIRTAAKYGRLSTDPEHEVPEITTPSILRAPDPSQDPWTADEKVTVVLEGLRTNMPGEALCRRQQISPWLYYRWVSRFVGGRKALAADDPE